MNKADWIFFIGWLIVGITPIVLKLTGVIAWSWLWVTSFLWVPTVLIAALVVLFVFCMWLGSTQQR